MPATNTKESAITNSGCYFIFTSDEANADADTAAKASAESGTHFAKVFELEFRKLPDQAPLVVVAAHLHETSGLTLSERKDRIIGILVMNKWLAISIFKRVLILSGIRNYNYIIGLHFQKLKNALKS